MAANIIDSFFVALGFKIDDKDLNRFKGEVDKAKDSVMQLRDVIGGMITGGVAMLAKSFLDTSAKFEKFETILTQLEGSAEKGHAAMEWVSKFAAKTPYELDGVTEAFVKLKSYGMDPIADGLLTTLGDTAAAMGKPIMQAVEAIADAVTGQNERLKEFGIKAAKTGNKIVYDYTNAAGEQVSKTVDASNRKMIQATLQAIWNEKYGGAMDKLSQTWEGMWSNFKDSVTRFKQVVMDSGPFKQIKSGLAKLLDSINAAFESGAVKRFGNVVGIVFATVVKMFEGVFDILDFVVEKTVGWKTVMIAASVVATGIFASALASTTKLIFGLARSIFAVNIAAAAWVLAIVAVGAAIALIVDDYREWKAGNDSLIGDLTQQFPWLLDAITAIENGVDTLVAFWLEQWAVLGPPLSELGAALWQLVSTVAEALWPVVKMLFGAWVQFMQLILPYVVQLVQWFSVHLVQAITGVAQLLTGFINKVVSAINFVRELLGLGGKSGGIKVDVQKQGGDKVADAVSQAPALTGAQATPAAGSSAPAAPGGVLGTAAGGTTNQTSTITQSTQITAPITVNSPDPAKAGESVRSELERMNKRVTRSGQTAVAL